MTDANRRKNLIIQNSPPYGAGGSYNGMRLANSLSKGPEDAVRLFLTGEGAAWARRGQQTPDGFYSLEQMLQVASRQGVSIGV